MRQRPSECPDAVAAPGLLRRLAASVYDAFLLVAVLFAATAVALPFNRGEAFTSGQIFYPLYLIGVSYLFFAWFWTHGGQTLGMRAWKIKILTFDRRPIGWRQAALRFFAALLSWTACGLGFWWIAFDKRKRGWHDHLSKTTVFFESDSSAR